MNTLRRVSTNPAFTGLFWLVLRLYVGYEFLTAGWGKLTSGWIGNDKIGGFLQGALVKATNEEHPEVQGWYVGLVNNVFLPNAALFSTLVAFGETMVGLALIFGIFTKFAAFWGAVMNFSFLAAGISSSNPQMLLFEVAMLFGGIGVGYYGLDQFLKPYLKKLFPIGEAATEAGVKKTTGPSPAPRPVS